MNWVLIGVIAILVLNAYLGFRKGMVRIVLSLVALIATIFITMALTPVAGSFVKENTNWYSNLKSATYKGMETNNTVGQAFDKIGENGQAQVLPGADYSKLGFDNITGDVVDTLKLPDSLKNHIQANIDIDSFTTKGVSTAKDIVADFVSEQIASIIFNAIVFNVIFVIIYIVMQLIIRVADIVSRLPVLHQINKTGGLLLGLVKGLIVVWVFFMAITIFCDTELARTVFAYVNDNSFLAFLYNNNLILKLVFAII